MWAKRERRKSRSKLQPIFVTACSPLCSRSATSRSALHPIFDRLCSVFPSANAQLTCCGHCSHKMHCCSLESWFIIMYLGLCTKSTAIDINNFFIRNKQERNVWLFLQWVTTMETIQWYLQVVRHSHYYRAIVTICRHKKIGLTYESKRKWT